MAMALKSRAEVQLLQALNQNKAASVSFYLRDEQQKAALAGGEQDKQQKAAHAAATQREAAPARPLHSRRASAVNDNDGDDDDEQAVALVRQLEDNFVAVIGQHERDSEEERHGGNQVELNAVARRERHMAAQRVYAEHVRRVAEDIEGALIASADRVKAALAAIDSQLRTAFRSLEDDTRLLESTSADVLRLWDAELLALCQQRTRVVEDFARGLDAIERARAARVRDGLTALTAELMETAHALPPEVERVVEREARELNAVVLSNRMVYADLVARVATADVDAFVAARLAWERGQRHWRQLRHADALRTFHARLNSLEFADPAERREVLCALRAQQQAAHRDERLATLQQLEDARAALTPAQGTQILQRLRAAQAAEEAQSHGFFAQLLAVHAAKADAAQRLREALRLAVHGFGALAPEGEVDACRSALTHLLADSALEEFFRVAGGLRGELDAVVRRLDVSELIYDAHLAPLVASLDVLLAALPLESVMEAHGKGAERKALQATLDRMRKASKHDLLALLPALQGQVGVLVKLSDVGGALKQELGDVAGSLEQLIQEFGLTSADSHAAALATGAAASPPTGSSATGPPELSLAATHSSLDLQAVRKVQRRLGTLLYASELPAPIQRYLAAVAEQLALQTHANAVVDRVIAAQCDALLARRVQESKRFLEAMGREIERQSARLHRQTEKLAGFCLAAALCVEQSLERVRYVDLSALDLLDALKDEDDERLAALEAQYLQSCARVRHAPDDAVLALEFQAAAELLRRIEDEYRLFHRRVGLAADHHAIAIEQQRQAARSRLCASFGLRVSVSDAHPEALDVDAFLSVKCIDDIVSPAAPAVLDDAIAGGEDGGSARTENPQEGGTPHAVATEPSRVTPRTDAERSRRASRHAAVSPKAAAEAKLPFRASSGLEAEVEVEIPELAARLLSHDSSDDEAPATTDAAALTSRSEGAAGASSASSPVAAVATGLADAPHDASAETGDEAAELLAAELLELEQQQQQLAADKVANEFVRLEIPVSVVERLLIALRDAFVTRIDRDGERAAAAATESRAQRAADANLLLEERLRLHWPRTGRLGVQVHQPRLGELMSHRQRLERQLRALLNKGEAQEREFACRAERALAHAEHVRVQQLACQAQLPMHASLAALQGQEGRSTKLLNAFKSEAAEHVEALRTLTATHAGALAAAAQEFLRACAAQLFPDVAGCDVISGCDYHPAELRAAQAQVRALATAFRARYQRCLQSLSMTDGLGQRFGLPRRTAQERYRSEVTRCDERSATIDALLASLRALAAAAAAAPAEGGSVVDATLRLLLQLRAKMHSRGRYFGLLANASQLEVVPVEFDPSGGAVGGAAVLRDRDVVDAQDAQDAGSFLDFVCDVSARCRENTRAIYEQEGKLDELPPGAVPPSLDEYLLGLAAKARAYVLRQELVFREQVRAFEQLLGLAPERALTDLVARAQAALSRATGQLETGLEADLTELLVQKKAHADELRPALCSPNNVRALDALSAREAERSRRAVARLQLFRAQAVRALLQASSAFERELVALFRCLMTVLDSSVMTQADLQPLSGEPLAARKRKSLARLRKLARVQEAAGGGRAAEAARTDAELQRLAQLGETPRFPRRAWPALSPFGAHAVWAAQQAHMLSHDAEHALPRDEALAAIECAGFAATDPGACVALLTPAHRCLVRARDAAYAAFAAFCSAHSERLVASAHERLRDEVKAAQSWERGIAAMMRA
ncbi:hypothetical protein PybrP1_004955 [[Pythium] brassicae (nom. inval.)]|nr:hypothetical protein PybrP1_004955 [[Pythium] brassicae (nom. inval.)]